jgi:hypothetical protein
VPSQVKSIWGIQEVEGPHNKCTVTVTLVVADATGHGTSTSGTRSGRSFMEGGF